MKKKIIVLIITIVGMFLVACGNGQGTYFPDSSEMQANLEKKKYEVEIETIQNDDYSGTCLTAEKKDEYIEFYWLDDGSSITELAQELEDKYPDYNRLVSMEQDSKFGTFIFCSSEKAFDDSGIVIVEVKV